MPDLDGQDAFWPLKTQGRIYNPVGSTPCLTCIQSLYDGLWTLVSCRAIYIPASTASVAPSTLQQRQN